MELLSMGGYGAYVWTSYALTFGVVVVCVLQARHRHRRVVHDIRARLQAAERSE